jgi:hypothetical protein
VVLALSTSCIAGFRAQTEHHWRLEAVKSTTASDGGISTSLSVHRREAQDEDCLFAFHVRPGRISVSVSNKTEGALTLHAHGARHGAPDGVSRALVVVPTPWEGEPPSEIGPGATEKVFLWPRDWLRSGHDGKPATWKADSPLDGELVGGGSSKREVLSNARADIGRSFEITLPVRVGQDERLYRFTFTVDDVDVEFISWA